MWKEALILLLIYYIYKYIIYYILFERLIKHADKKCDPLIYSTMCYRKLSFFSIIQWFSFIWYAWILHYYSILHCL